MSQLIHNYPLWASIWAILIAQFLKIPLYYMHYKKWDFELFFSTGRMPSSHSAAVAALTVSLGIQEGWNSPSFAIGFILASIVMFDAAGIRRHAGEHAALLNQIFFGTTTPSGVTPDEKKNVEEEPGMKPLEELLGHKPIEVAGGALLGILVALALA
ncbi:MAG: divergent PAP2 family protein [Thermicanus sp.]|nr:divergent PAP2 family protein [Thermicanus sp.]